MERPPMRISGPVLDAADPVALARFWSRLLGWELREVEGPRPGFPAGDAWARIWSPDGRHKIEFQWDEHYVAPTWPSAPGEQQMMIHLDVAVEDLEAGLAWALDAGATVVDHQPQEDLYVLLDPAGHPFCLFRGWVHGDPPAPPG